MDKCYTGIPKGEHRPIMHLAGCLFIPYFKGDM